jgi:predicted transcriptional regulator
MEKLTSAEERVMQALWQIEKGFVRDVMAEMQTDLSYNTVSTLIRTLEKKGYVSHRAYGNTYEYFPSIPQADYAKHKTRGLLDRYFGGSLSQMVSFFMKEEDLRVKELEDIQSMIKKSKADEDNKKDTPNA